MSDRTRPSAAARLASFAIAVLATVMMLAGVDRLASVDSGAPQLVQVAPARGA